YLEQRSNRLPGSRLCSLAINQSRRQGLVRGKPGLPFTGIHDMDCITGCGTLRSAGAVPLAVEIRLPIGPALPSTQDRATRLFRTHSRQRGISMAAPTPATIGRPVKKRYYFENG